MTDREQPPEIRLILGDCLEVMRSLPSESVDAIVCDPPAGISFMGKAFDSNRGGRAQWVEWLRERMGEALRLTRPGGHALVWALPRTSHWTATAVEDAGWEVREVVTHLFSQGFPKSLDISKAIDKAAGCERLRIPGGVGTANTASLGAFRPGEAISGEAISWSGWGTALKPASEHWILARKPIVGTVAANVLKHGTGGLNIDGCRVKSGQRDTRIHSKEHIHSGQFGASDGTPSQIIGHYESTGRFPTNLVFSHHPDCVQAGTKRVKTGTAYEPEPKPMERSIYSETNTLGRECGYAGADGMETVAAWECVAGCPVAELDRQSGDCKGMGVTRVPNRGGTTGKGMGYGSSSPSSAEMVGYSDSGGASRFYPTFAFEADDFAPFIYEAKAAKGDRNEGAVNKHPTVKSTALCRWLCRLITPQGGTILDPFMGSGSTLKAAMLEGFGAIGIEVDATYFAIAQARVKAVEMPLFPNIAESTQ